MAPEGEPEPARGPWPALAVVLVLACLLLTTLGAFVRLSHAGLGCPDWPTCYGQLAWPTTHQDIAAANLRFPDRPVEVHKTWPEQVHRHLAALVGLGVLALSLVASRGRRGSLAAHGLLVGGVLAAIWLYAAGHPWLALALAAAAVGQLLLRASRWAGAARWYGCTLALIVFQALLGKWTVTLLLKPIVVTAHLLGGFATLLLLVLAARALWREQEGVPPAPADHARPKRVHPVWLALAALALVAQIALGGWTSSNYAALACPDFPTCQGRLWPEADFREAFVLWRGLGVDYEGGVLTGEARTAIHVTHRLGAVVTTGLLAIPVLAGLARRRTRAPAALTGSLLLAQLALGIANVKLGLPLPVATAHNAVAALLMLSLAWLTWRWREART